MSSAANSTGQSHSRFVSDERKQESNWQKNPNNNNVTSEASVYDVDLFAPKHDRFTLTPEALVTKVC